MGKLYNSMVGAVLNEVLRVTPPVLQIPKIRRGGPIQLTIDGKSITMPANTYIDMETVTTHRNPKHFPHSPSKVTSKWNDLDDFVPERWLLPKSGSTANDSSVSQGLVEPNLVDGLETVSFEAQGSLFRPVKGAFIPFSEGARSCPGRRFAQVEVTAVLAVIFKQYSVELDVSAWASDDEVAAMSPKGKKEVYEKAQKKARQLIRGSKTVLTLKMVDAMPLRLVKRGNERFAGLGI